MTPERLGLLWGVTVFSGAGARLLAAISGLPGVVLLLLSGLLIGRSGLGLVEPLDLGPGLGTVVGLLVSLVLFDGGLNLRLPGDTIRSTVQRIAILRLRMDNPCETEGDEGEGMSYHYAVSSLLRPCRASLRT